jgi:mono/diheme cytochrome c family protein
MKSLYAYAGLTLAAVLIAVAAPALTTPAKAQLAAPLSPQQGGEATYKGICQSCHMPDARGAKGAGAYPALAGNEKLSVSGYPVSVVVHGLKTMPAFGGLLSDQQIADVVNYVRTHFGNHYTDLVTPDDVKAAR